MSMQPYFHELQMSEKKIWCKNEISRISSSTLTSSFHRIHFSGTVSLVLPPLLGHFYCSAHAHAVEH